ncbi:ABC transporter substrate-binding protein [Agilicoccus flavus]|uniref:ABC transporter substrate-binding protein n=1 Tax=Agilicoccus flavus TaxID=2775968 RepID=UPI001CF6E77E|nr:sugar ABC transporter substrate-binding protein [Agilicoccus flavus]
MRRRRTDRTRTRAATALALAVAVGSAVGLSGCAKGESAAGAGGTISYWLWDSAQQPGYQKCADAFAAENPGLRVRITQYGWDDYWSKLTAGFIADTAPDVFTDHLGKFAQFADLGVLRPLDDLQATKDIADDDYQEGLATLWKGQDGKRYGAPKDWDTVALFYNAKMLADAGITKEQVDSAAWNPDDGGTFEKMVARLTVDAKGRRGDEPGFDKNRVKVYGMAIDHGGGDGYGQTQWSPFTGSSGTGWQYLDKNPWGTRFRFDSPDVQKTLGWYFGLVRKGYMPPYEVTAGDLDKNKQLAAGTAAMTVDGSWMISTYSGFTNAAGEKTPIGIAPTPVGPAGKRASMFNGLADSVTTNSTQPENAAKWVKFLSGQTCQDIIGNAGVVFPARRSGTELAVAYNKRERNLDVTPFTEQVSEKSTFLYPVVYYAEDIKAILGPGMNAIYIGQEPVSAMTTFNEQINLLLSQRG